MTRFEKIRSGLWEEDRGGDLELTLKGRQYFCKHEHWVVKFYNKEGKPNVMECVSCHKTNYL